MFSLRDSSVSDRLVANIPSNFREAQDASEAKVQGHVILKVLCAGSSMPVQEPEAAGQQAA